MGIKVRHLSGVWMMFLLSVTSVAATAADLRLLEAVRQRDKETVRSLLKEPVEVNARQADGATALHWAAHWDDLEAAELLIRSGAEVNAANDYGVTPLSLACTNANAAMVETLLKAGADANAVLPTGETALMTCARTGNPDAVKSLLARRADANAKETESGQSPLMWAAAQGHAEAAQALIEQGADVHARSKGGFTPLLFAARVGNVDSAQVLLTAGANVNEAMPVQSKPEASGDVPAGSMTPLLMASASGHEKLAVFFLERGADPNAWDGGASAIHYALLHGMANIGGVPRANYVTFLLRPNMPELVKALLDRGANPNVRVVSSALTGGAGGFRGTVGATPFLLATATNDIPLMRLLVASGADPLIPTRANVTPLMVAAGAIGGNSRPEEERTGFRDALETVKLTLELGNDVNATDSGGRTALHGAAYTGSDPVVQFLVDKGAAVDAKDKRGETPWSLAVALNNAGDIRHESTGNLLLKLGAKRLTASDFPR